MRMVQCYPLCSEQLAQKFFKSIVVIGSATTWFSTWLCISFEHTCKGRPKISLQEPKKFLGDMSLFFFFFFFWRRGHLTPKINIPFFITNLMLNIFAVNNFFRKSVFSEETAKNCSEGTQLWELLWTNFWLALYYIYGEPIRQFITQTSCHTIEHTVWRI